MFVTEIRPLNKKKSRILFDDGEDLVLYNGEIRASRIKEQEELPDEVYEKLAIRCSTAALKMVWTRFGLYVIRICRFHLSASL